MLWVQDHYKYVYFYSVTLDVRFWRQILMYRDYPRAVNDNFILFSFWAIYIFKPDTKMYTLYHYVIIIVLYNIGGAALERA